MAAHPRLGALLFGLLACNTIYYILAGRFSEALESVAWYALLILFVLETANQRLRCSARIRTAVRGVRLVASLSILASAVLYSREKQWLDASNLLLWISVIALLEIAIRHPSFVAVNRNAFTTAALTLYAALAVLVVVWLVKEKWMNAWDATLWLAAFGLIELEIVTAKPEIV